MLLLQPLQSSRIIAPTGFSPSRGYAWNKYSGVQIKKKEIQAGREGSAAKEEETSSIVRQQRTGAW